MSYGGSGGGMKAKNTSPQEIEASSAVHLTFDSFEPVDLPFYLTVTPIRLDGRGNGGDILL